MTATRFNRKCFKMDEIDKILADLQSASIIFRLPALTDLITKAHAAFSAVISDVETIKAQLAEIVPAPAPVVDPVDRVAATAPYTNPMTTAAPAPLADGATGGAGGQPG